jgi:hypothetical protein
VIWCEPAESVEVVKVAPPLRSATEPSAVVPSRKLIVSIGVPTADETVAERMTTFSIRVGLAEEINETVGVAWLTTIVRDTVGAAV